MSLIKKQYIHESNYIRNLGTNKYVRPQEAVYAPEEPENKVLVDAYERQQIIDEITTKAKTEAENIRSSILGDIEQQKQQTEEELTQARTEASKLKEEAEKARQEGFENGRNEALAQLKDLVQEAMEAVRQARDQRNLIIKSAEPELLKLSVKIANQVIRSEMSVNPEVVMNIVRDAIEKISDNEQVVIKVSQHDLQTVRNNKDLIIDLVEAKNLSIVPDKHVSDGGCLIETKLGFIDARVATKLELIETALTSIYSDEQKKQEQLNREAIARGETVEEEEWEVPDPVSEEEPINNTVTAEETPAEIK